MLEIILKILLILLKVANNNHIVSGFGKYPLR